MATKDNTTKPDLLRCPFCDGAASISSNTERVAFIGCHNYGICEALPQITSSCYEPTLISDMHKWNRRA